MVKYGRAKLKWLITNCTCLTALLRSCFNLYIHLQYIQWSNREWRPSVWSAAAESFNKICKLKARLRVVLQINAAHQRAPIPMLFLIYINDITKASSFHTTLFADDINLHMSNSSFNILQTTVNLELCKIDHWLRANKLSLNYNKTNFMLLTSRKHNHASFKVIINKPQHFPWR